MPTVYWNGFGMGRMDMPLKFKHGVKLVKLLAEDIVSYCRSVLLQLSHSTPESLWKSTATF